ncbi:hypothetical protein [Streptomyces sp. TE5632]
MTNNADAEIAEQRWDEPWHRVRTDRFEASLLPDAGENLEAVCNVDVEVRLAEGSRRSTTVLTITEVQRLMDKRASRNRVWGWVRAGQA